VKIDSYQFGRIVIDGQSHRRDVIILSDRVVKGWWRREGHVLHADDLESVIQTAPEILVVGQGAYGRMRVTSETRRALEVAGIELIALPTEEACQTFNRMRGDRTIAAALHLTC
jgi:hypothetical protein